MCPKDIELSEIYAYNYIHAKLIWMIENILQILS